MALPPAYAAHRIFASPTPIHTLEVYLDYTCPFSAKLWHTLTDSVIPYFTESKTPISVIFRHQVQPWHPTSTLLHEASLAVERLSPSSFKAYSDTLFKCQKLFFDEVTVDKTRGEIYRELCTIAVETGAVDTAEEMLTLLEIVKGEPRNAGNRVMADLKYHVKLSRYNAVHVSPTVVFDGIRDDSVSSSWGIEQWKQWISTKI